jgi:RimJ/RimL family protein N-acetyltransferase
VSHSNDFGLRQVKILEDLHFFFAVRNDSSLQRLLLSSRENSSENEVTKWLSFKSRDDDTIFRVIEDVSTGTAVGYLQLTKIAFSRNYQLGICCGSDFRGKGAGRIALTDGFDLLKIANANKVILEVDKSNHKAISLYTSEGFRTVGEMLRHIFIHGEFVDVVIMEKLI